MDFDRELEKTLIAEELINRTNNHLYKIVEDISKLDSNDTAFIESILRSRNCLSEDIMVIIESFGTDNIGRLLIVATGMSNGKTVLADQHAVAMIKELLKEYGKELNPSNIEEIAGITQKAAEKYRTLVRKDLSREERSREIVKIRRGYEKAIIAILS